MAGRRIAANVRERPTACSRKGPPFDMRDCSENACVCGRSVTFAALCWLCVCAGQFMENVKPL